MPRCVYMLTQQALYPHVSCAKEVTYILWLKGVKGSNSSCKIYLGNSALFTLTNEANISWPVLLSFQQLQLN